MILDVGSGSEKWMHFAHTVVDHNILHFDICRYDGETDMVGDIHHLPFADAVFNVVHAAHILEHVDRPLEALRELARVAENTVIVKVPNAAFYRWHKQFHEHIYCWNHQTFKAFLQRVFSDPVVSSGYHRGTVGRLRHMFAYVTTIFHGDNELIGVCHKNDGDAVHIPLR